MRFMLDTNICIYMLGGHASVASRFDQHREGICISSIVLSEMRYGAAKSARPAANRLALDAFLGLVPVMDYGQPAADHYGDIKAALFAAGKPIGPLDTLIAAHARALGLILVTNNTREFDRVPGLTVENWV